MAFGLGGGVGSEEGTAGADADGAGGRWVRVETRAYGSGCYS